MEEYLSEELASNSNDDKCIRAAQNRVPTKRRKSRSTRGKVCPTGARVRVLLRRRIPILIHNFLLFAVIFTQVDNSVTRLVTPDSKTCASLVACQATGSATVHIHQSQIRVQEWHWPLTALVQDLVSSHPSMFYVHNS